MFCTSGSSDSASAVGCNRPLRRTNSGTPRSVSNWLNRRLTAGCDEPSRCAASMVEPVVMKARKASSCLKFILSRGVRNIGAARHGTREA